MVAQCGTLSRRVNWEIALLTESDSLEIVSKAGSRDYNYNYNPLPRRNNPLREKFLKNFIAKKLPRCQLDCLIPKKASTQFALDCLGPCLIVFPVAYSSTPR